MSASNSTVQLPEPIRAAAHRHAAQNGLSVDEWVAEAVVLRLDDAESTQKFFRMRAAGARKGAFGEALRAIPSRAPDPKDTF